MTPQEKLDEIVRIYEPHPHRTSATSGHARLNLEGALYDLERRGADEVSLRTIRRVIAQLAAIEAVLGERLRP